MEAYCSYEICKLLKKKGFNEPCSSTYDTAVSGGKPMFYKYDVLHFFPNGMKNSDDRREITEEEILSLVDWYLDKKADEGENGIGFESQARDGMNVIMEFRNREEEENGR